MINQDSIQSTNVKMCSSAKLEQGIDIRNDLANSIQ